LTCRADNKQEKDFDFWEGLVFSRLLQLYNLLEKKTNILSHILWLIFPKHLWTDLKMTEKNKLSFFSWLSSNPNMAEDTFWLKKMADVIKNKRRCLGERFSCRLVCVL